MTSANLRNVAKKQHSAFTESDKYEGALVASFGWVPFIELVNEKIQKMDRQNRSTGSSATAEIARDADDAD